MMADCDVFSREMTLLEKALFRYLSKDNENVVTMKARQFISNMQIDFKMLWNMSILTR